MKTIRFLHARFYYIVMAIERKIIGDILKNVRRKKQVFLC